MAERKPGIDRTHGGAPFLFSSYSRAGDDCIGVAADLVALGTVAVMDSKDPAGPVVVVDDTAWGAFLSYAKA